MNSKSTPIIEPNDSIVDYSDEKLREIKISLKEDKITKMSKKEEIKYDEAFFDTIDFLRRNRHCL